MFGFFRRKKDSRPSDEELRERIAEKLNSYNDDLKKSEFKADEKPDPGIIVAEAVDFDDLWNQINGRDQAINKRLK